MIEAHVLRHPNLSKILEVPCDTSGVEIGGILSQNGHNVTFFSQKTQ